MSESDKQKEYWQNYNNMLRDDELEFGLPSKKERIGVRRLVYSNSDNQVLLGGVQYALSHFDEIATMERENNLNQPKSITWKHLHWARVFIEGNTVGEQYKEELLQTTGNEEIITLNALRHVSFGEFLLSCYLKAQEEPLTFVVYVDSCRASFVENMFGDPYLRSDVPVNEVAKLLQSESNGCTQIIFDSGDLSSALDALLTNLTDRTSAPWRIQSVYFQESLKNAVYDTLTTDRLNAVNDVDSKLSEHEKQLLDNEKIATTFGGRLITSSNDSINLLFHVPVKHLRTATSSANAAKLHYTPVAINFFRTAKEVIQLVNADHKNLMKRLTTIWTENVALLYELSANLNSNIIWNNSVGSFDKSMPCLKKDLNLSSIANNAVRYKKISFTLEYIETIFSF